MSGMEEEGENKNYSRNIVWTMDGCLHQLVKIRDKTDDRVFHQVPETWQNLVKMNFGGRQLFANLKMTSLMVKARSGLRARNNPPQRRRDLVKQWMRTEMYFKEVWRVTVFLRGNIGGGELLSMEPYACLPSGFVEIKVVNIIGVGEGPLNLGRMLQIYLKSHQGSIVFNMGERIMVSDRMMWVVAEVLTCSQGPTCMVDRMEQVRVVDQEGQIE